MLTYRTITSISEGFYSEKGSKFLSFAIPVSNKEEIKQILKDYRSNFHDARHICYAWMLGPDRLDFRANDNGEPSGTAGRPILGQINSQNLTNILIVVVRYFGGILLGTGGLNSAYKEAAADALHQATIIEKEVTVQYHVVFDYPAMNDIMHLIKTHNIEIITQQFEEKCLLKIEVPIQKIEIIMNKLKEKSEEIEKIQ